MAMTNRSAASSIIGIEDMCCGCGACAAACPRGCIKMKEDHLGFIRPTLDIKECVGCGVCKRACPSMKRGLARDCCEQVFWARAIDAGMINQSSSGGVFGLLARKVLDENGIVVGAAWVEDCKGVRHIVIEDISKLDTVMRSKYVQSEVSPEVYHAVRAAILGGRHVLFSGTSCQVAGMRGYLGKLTESNQFLSVDVICHGVPTPLLWRKWLDFVEREEKGHIFDINMRDKHDKKTPYSINYKMVSERGVEFSHVLAVDDDWYMRTFLSNVSLRSACYDCPSKRSSGSDITLGDYWGVREQHPEINNGNGFSAVIINTAKGRRAMNNILSEIYCGESSIERVLSGNPSLTSSVSPSVDRSRFMSALSSGMSIPGLMMHWKCKRSRLNQTVSYIKKEIISKLRSL